MKTKILTTCKNSFEANLLKGKLIDSGIDAFLINENFSSLMPNYHFMMESGVKVVVAEENFNEAQKIIEVKKKLESAQIVAQQILSSSIQILLPRYF